MKKMFGLVALMLCALLCCSCGSSTPAEVYATKAEVVDEVTNFVQIELENGGIIQVELYPDVAPQTVANFQKLVSEHYYDGTIFHRVIYNFMVQGGDGADTETIYGEFASNGFTNDLAHERGVISMARTSIPDSASSQFFIVHKDQPHLDGDYAAFGRVTAGMETVDWIASQATDGRDCPVEDIVMKEVRFIKG